MVNGFEEEVKALEEYGHDCCARIDDRIHECCKRIKEAHEQELDNARCAYEISMALMEKQSPPVTYDVLDNERHKAVCELRKLPDGYPSYSSFPFAKWYKDLSLALGISALGVSGGELSCARVRDTLIHLLGGDQMPVTLGDPCGILKGDSDGVDVGGCVEARVDRAVYGADGRVADSTGDSHAEGVAPITTELRNACGDANDMVSFAAIESHDFDRLCDAIDAVHAGLERDYKVACEANERQDELYADVVHRLDRAYEKNRNQRRQLTEVQEALHRRNEGELKVRWQKEIDRLEREKKDLELQVAKMHLESIGPPKDADGEVIRVGDKVEYTDEPGVPRDVSSLYLDGEGWWVYVGFTGRRPDKYRHYHSDTWERIIYAAMQAGRTDESVDVTSLIARCKALAGGAE